MRRATATMWFFDPSIRIVCLLTSKEPPFKLIVDFSLYNRYYHLTGIAKSQQQVS